MSVEAIAIVLNHSRATGNDKVILIGIANHEGDGGSFPAISTLARYAGISPRNVQKAIGRLVELRELKVIVGGGGKRETPEYARTNLYRIQVKCPPTCDRTMNHRTVGDDDGDDGSAAVPAIVTDPPSGPTSPVAGDGGSSPVAGDTGAPVAGDTSPLSQATPKPSQQPATEPAATGSTPQPPSPGGLGAVILAGTGRNHVCPPAGCRACGTSPRQLAEAARRASLERTRLEERERLAAERAAAEAARPDPARLADLAAQARQGLR